MDLQVSQYKKWHIPNNFKGDDNLLYPYLRLPMPNLKFTLKPQYDILMSLLVLDINKNWVVICENFIEITYDRDLLKNPWSEIAGLSNYGLYSTLDTYSIPHELIPADKASFLLYLKSIISKGFYLFYNHDTFFVHQYLEPHIHQRHEIILYGYDDEKSVFYAKDYFDFKISKESVISYEEVYLAYINYRRICFEPRFFDYLRGMKLLRPNERHSRELELDFGKVHYSLQTLLKGKDRLDKLISSSSLEYFDCLILYLRNKDKSSIIDIRLFHLIYVHVSLMKVRLLIFSLFYTDAKFFSFLERIHRIHELSVKCQAVVIKYNVMFEKKKILDDKEIVKIVSSIEDIYDTYYRLVYDLSDFIRNHIISAKIEISNNALTALKNILLSEG